MRPVLALFCTTLVAGTAAAAETFTLVCVPDDTAENWRITTTVDPESASLDWDGERWDIVSIDARAIVARQMEQGRPASLLINRETGRFWQTFIGRYCNNADCSSTVLSSLVIQGRCEE